MRNYLSRHGRGFKFRFAVPHDLRAVVGRKEWRRYLGLNENNARKLAIDHAEWCRREVASLRKLTPAEHATIIDAGGSARFEAYVRAAEASAHLIARAAGFAATIDPDADDPEELEAMLALENQRALRDVARLRAEALTGRKTLAKLKGEPGALLGLVDLYADVRRPSPKVVQKMRTYVARFVEATGDINPRDVTRDHVIAFREWLEKHEKTHSNIVQHLDKINTLFNVALSEGAVAANPAHKIKARKDANAKHSQKRQDFTSAQIKMIMKGLKGESDDFAWVMRLLIYHGARSGEICQLRSADVPQLHGVDVLRIHDQYGTVKNRASVRDIPLHPKCKGLIAYARKVAAKRGNDAWLFQSFDPAAGHGRGHRFQNYGNAVFLRGKLGIADRRLTLHSLRHTWRTCARELGMPEPVSRAIMGHSLGKDDHGAYGGVPSLKLRAKWIAKIDPLA